VQDGGFICSFSENFKLAETNKTVADFIQPPQDKIVANSVLTTLPLAQLTDFPNHPFRLYDGERKDDMIDSIREKGILQPIIVRAPEEGQYHILLGHNRKYCGIEAELEAAPVIIKSNFTDMLLSEKKRLYFICSTPKCSRRVRELTLQTNLNLSQIRMITGGAELVRKL